MQMAKSKSLLSSFLLLLLLALAPICFCTENYGRHHLYPQFYDHSCPQAQKIIRAGVEKAWKKDRRNAASLLRLLFHDCFVQGCDASLLLDNSGSIESEKRSNPNKKSARGFEIIDEIKFELEQECPETVSCADTLATIARDAVVITGGPHWEVPLGRRDSTTASLSGSNKDIPAPINTFDTILAKFKRVGLDLTDLVALSGSHTIGAARCTSFRERLYNQAGTGKPDYSLNKYYAAKLRNRCPKSGSAQNLFFLDYSTPYKFDNSYYKNLIAYEGLMNSDEVLLTKNKQAMKLVKQYAENQKLFFDHFTKSMIKMGNISPLTGKQGEIRTVCRRVNNY